MCYVSYWGSPTDNSATLTEFGAGLGIQMLALSLCTHVTS